MSNVQLSKYQHPTPFKRFAAPGPVDALGDVAFAFPTLPMGTEAQVTFVVPGSPAGVVWTVNVNGQPVGSMVGNLPFGVLYIADTDTITITGTFFPFAESATLFPVGNAVMVGSTAPTGVLGPTAPTIGGGEATGLIKLASGTTSGAGAGTTTVVLSVNAIGVIIQANNVPLFPPTLGGPDNQGTGPYIPLDAGAAYLQAQQTVGSATGHWFFPRLNLITFSTLFAAATTYSIYEVDSDYAITGLAHSIPAESVAVPNPPPGTDWNWTMLAPARLTVVTATLVCSIAVANRSTYLFLQSGAQSMIPMSSVVLTSGQTFIHNGFPAAGLSTRTGDNHGLFSTPDILLGAGDTIASVTSGIDVADQWENVVLTFQTI